MGIVRLHAAGETAVTYQRMRVLMPVLLGLALLPSVAHAQSGPQAFTATAILSYSTNDLHLPLSSRQDRGAFRATSSIRYSDATHWRVDTTTDEPALLQGTSTYVANGATLTTRYGLLGQVFSSPIPSGPASASVGNTLMMGFYRPHATSVMEYVTAHRGHGSHATIMDQSTLLGQPVTVIKIWPVMTGESRSCTSSTKSAHPICTTHRYSYGEIMLWIDTRHLVPLRVQELNLPNTFQQDLAFQVTSITYGQGPSAQDLAVDPTPSPTPNIPGNTTSLSSGGLGPNARWAVPAGFIPATAPRGWQIRGQEEGHFPGNDIPIASVAGLFMPTSTPQQSNQRANPSRRYLLIEEQWRATGSPPFFQTGAKHDVGACEVWTGLYPNGTRWLGYTRGNVSLLATTNAFSQAQLVLYAAQHICAKG